VFDFEIEVADPFVEHLGMLNLFCAAGAEAA